jgi:hypothetical protein
MHENDDRTAAGDPVHHAMAVQKHLIACNAWKIDRALSSAALRALGSGAASPCGQAAGEHRGTQSGAGHEQPSALEVRHQRVRSGGAEHGDETGYTDHTADLTEAA